MKILLGVDGNRTSILLHELARLVQLDMADLLLAYVHDTGARGEMELLRSRLAGRTVPTERLEQMTAAERASTDEVLEEARQLGRPLAHSIEAEAAAGEPGRVLCKTASARGVQLMAVGARSGALVVPADAHSLGHTARFVVDHAPCPVLILRHAAP